MEMGRRGEERRLERMGVWEGNCEKEKIAFRSF